MKKLSIIIPAYNEEDTLLDILKLVESVRLDKIEKEIVIVDDGSTDKTRDILKTLEDKYKIIYQPENMGKGAAVRTGFLEATGDIIIVQDADMEYDPHEYYRVIKPILDDRADVVYGSRFIGSNPRSVFNFWHYRSNKFLTWFSNMLTGLSLTDMETCYKAFSRQALDKIKHKLTASRFGIEPEMTAQIAKNKLRIFEVGISYYGRTYQEGKKIGWKDGLAAIFHIIKFNLFR